MATKSGKSGANALPVNPRHYGMADRNLENAIIRERNRRDDRALDTLVSKLEQGNCAEKALMQAQMQAYQPLSVRLETCENCGKRSVPGMSLPETHDTPRKLHFCSKMCFKAFRTMKLGEPVCAMCGVMKPPVFVLKSPSPAAGPDAPFCSRTCYDTFVRDSGVVRAKGATPRGGASRPVRDYSDLPTSTMGSSSYYKPMPTDRVANFYKTSSEMMNDALLLK
eukprot:comp24305_c0_seq1/m.60096 comp24305_c0_seq1/g.60096  ORF comp24305_c0_seq1/g.60096 comp24305_c0_seq1/m.60096 type:complete len:223 (-) comp24305_c0_seq1:67-735(-)